MRSIQATATIAAMVLGTFSLAVITRGDRSPAQEAASRAPARACLTGYLDSTFGCLPRANCPDGQAEIDGRCIPASPPAVSVAAQPVPLGTSTPTTVEQIMVRLARITAQLYGTSGFRNRPAILAAAQAEGGTMAKAAEILMNEHLEVAMARTSNRRDQILTSGFVTFREAAGVTSSGGAVRGREVVEGNYLAIQGARYAAASPGLKPKSAYLKARPCGRYNDPVTTEAYGDDRYVFKLEPLRDRISLTAGDSLNRRLAGVGNLTDDLKGPITSWDQVYTPWSQRELLIPFLAAGLGEGRVGVNMSTFSATPEDIDSRPASVRERIVPVTPNPKSGKEALWTTIDTPEYHGTGAFTNYTSLWSTALDYIEVQIWKPRLTLDDVQAFEFTKTPPSGDFLRALQARGIEIRDRRPGAADTCRGQGANSGAGDRARETPQIR